jgi:hypothetical protein
VSMFESIYEYMYRFIFMTISMLMTCFCPCPCPCQYSCIVLLSCESISYIIRSIFSYGVSPYSLRTVVVYSPVCSAYAVPDHLKTTSMSVQFSQRN